MGVDPFQVQHQGIWASQQSMSVYGKQNHTKVIKNARLIDAKVKKSLTPDRSLRVVIAP